MSLEKRKLTFSFISTVFPLFHFAKEKLSFHLPFNTCRKSFSLAFAASFTWESLFDKILGLDSPAFSNFTWAEVLWRWMFHLLFLKFWFGSLMVSVALPEILVVVWFWWWKQVRWECDLYGWWERGKVSSVGLTSILPFFLFDFNYDISLVSLPLVTSSSAA